MDSARSQGSSKSGATSARSSNPTKPAEPKELTADQKNGIFIAQKTEIHGRVSFGNNCIVHPLCSIIAEGGDIIIGDHNIIEEKVRIVNRLKKDENGKPIKRDMHIGSYNVFEVQAQIDSSEIGDLNEFQHRCIVQEGCKIERYCQVNPCVTVNKGTHLESYSVVYDDGKIRKNLEPNEEAKKISIEELCTFLADQLPKHNKPRDS